MPLTPMATSVMPHRHGRPKLSEMSTGTSTPKDALNCRSYPGGRGVRIDGQQRHHVAAARPHVRGVDAAVGADEAVVGLGDEHAVGHPDDASSLSQDDLQLAGVAVPALGEGHDLRTRLDGREVHDRALGLGDDLLGDDQDVALEQRQRRRRRPQRFDQRRGQVVAGADLRHALEGDDRHAPFRRSGAAGDRVGAHRPASWSSPSRSASSRSSGVSTSKDSGPSSST